MCWLLREYGIPEDISPGVTIDITPHFLYFCNSVSITLAAIYLAFHRLTSLATFSTIAAASANYPTAVITLLTAPSGEFSLDLLASVAGRHSQRTFSRAAFSDLLARVLALPLPAPALARIRHAAAHGASALFSAYYIPACSALSTEATQFLFCHRLGIPLPFLPSPPPAHCHPRCHAYPPSRPIPASHYLHPLIGHAYHQLACRVGPHRHRKHDALNALIAATVREMLKVDATTAESSLYSSTTSGKKVDIIITSYDLHPPITAIDSTVSCPMLPTYVAAAALSASALFTARSDEKMDKHLPGCVELGRSFLAIVFSSLGGIGPAAAVDYMDSIFSPALTSERLAGGSGQRTAHRRLLFQQSLSAVIARASADAIRYLLTGRSTD